MISVEWGEFVSDAAMAFLTFGLLVRTYVTEYKPKGSSGNYNVIVKLQPLAEKSLLWIVGITFASYMASLVLRTCVSSAGT